ncbi:ribosome assembly factor SBDS [Tardisphaera miroshnichenkoae]
MQLDIGKNTIVRLELKGQKFEVVVVPEKAWKYKEGEQIPLKDVFVTEEVFKDVGKGEKASATNLVQVFGTDDESKVALEVLKRGELLLTTEQRREMVEAKRKQIINLISKSAVDPKTKLPHPPTRIELALNQARFAVDPFKPVEEQVNEAIKVLKPILPIKIVQFNFRVKVPATYASRTYKQITSLGQLKSSQWGDDGSITVTITVPGGARSEVMEKINSLTHGSAEVTVEEA